jgi:hypothetical protein
MSGSTRFLGHTGTVAGDRSLLPRRLNLLWIAVTLALILLCTGIIALGDTAVYVADIVAYMGKSSAGPANPLWDAGHLLWRPLGWGLLSVLGPFLSTITNWAPAIQATFLLISVSAISGLISVMLWFSLARHFSDSDSIAFLVALAAACSHGCLLYTQSGCSYIFGLTLLTASLYCLIFNRTIAGAIFYALSVLTWLPYILAGAALLIVILFPPGGASNPASQRLARVGWSGAISFTLVSAAITATAYGLVIYRLRLSSLQDVLAWVVASGHGWDQNSRLLRAATGLPRSLLFLGKDGILYKRYLRHDPYSPVTLMDIVSASLWKLASFYLFIACLLRELLRKRCGWPLLVSAAVVIPVVFFAIVVFEPGSPERYLPILPFLVIAISWVLRDFPVSRSFTQTAIAMFLVCVILTNGYAFAGWRTNVMNKTSLARVADLRIRMKPAGTAMITTNQDELAEVLGRLPFDSVNRPAPLPVYHVIVPGNISVKMWRENFAIKTLTIWRASGDVWISTRLLSQRPQPSWNWVEGDDPRIRWRDLPDFFTQIDTDARSGGPDGFLRLAESPANLALLNRLATGRAEP